MKRVTWMLALAAAFAAYLGCATTPASAEQGKLVKAELAASTTWWGQIPLMVAIDKGFFRDAGLDVTLRSITNSSDRIAAVASGSAVFSNLGRIAVIADMARGDESFWYFANIDDSPGNEGCWARPGFTSWAQLKGHKVAANTSAQITMDGLLQNAGMTENDVRFVNLPPNEMAPALAKGDVDAACVWQPLLAGVKKAVPGGKLLGLDSLKTRLHSEQQPALMAASALRARLGLKEIGLDHQWADGSAHLDRPDRLLASAISLRCLNRSSAAPRRLPERALLAVTTTDVGAGAVATGVGLLISQPVSDMSAMAAAAVTRTVV